jgi:hypothetical protein
MTFPYGFSHDTEASLIVGFMTPREMITTSTVGRSTNSELQRLRTRERLGLPGNPLSSPRDLGRRQGAPSRRIHLS